MTAARRMTRAGRRAQLLRVALEVVREEGTEALTLARLAERAGVTKPVAYEHFGSRAGLLIALFRDYDDKTTVAVREALKTGGGSLEGVAAILAAAYVDTCLAMGPEIGAVYHALTASPETEAFRRGWREFLVGEFRRALAPFVGLPKREGGAVLLGVVGAAEVLAEAAAAGRMTRGEAVGVLVKIMTGALRSGQTPSAGRSEA